LEIFGHKAKQLAIAEDAELIATHQFIGLLTDILSCMSDVDAETE
jgi:hypothetical protein